MDPQAKSTVCWLPADPESGGASMLRWWAALAAAAENHPDFTWSCPLGDPPAFETSPRTGRWSTAFRKYAAYPWKVRRHPKADLYHLLDHSWAHLLEAVPKGIPTIATVHDLIPMRYPDGLTQSQLQRWRRVVGRIRGCQYVAADSEATRQEVIELLGVSSDKVGVIPLGVDLSPRPIPPPTRVSSSIAALRRAGADLVIGCLGSGVGRKNLGIIPPSLQILAGKGLRVAVARGGAPLPRELTEAFAPFESDHLFCDLGFLSDQQVDEFYRAIDVLVMPSLYEGFGLPVIEAMAAGVPVTCSNTTSLPEVAGDAALLFDPTVPEALADCLEKYHSPEVRGHQGRLGVARANEFSWHRTLAGYCSLYKKFT